MKAVVYDRYGPPDVLRMERLPVPAAFAFSNVHYALQVLWYIAMGAIGLATPWVSFHDLWTARKTGAADP